MAAVCVGLSLSLTHISIFHIDSNNFNKCACFSVWFWWLMCVCVKVDSAVCVCVEGLALWFASLMWFGYEKSNGSPTVPRQTHTHTHTHTSIKPYQRNFPAKTSPGISLICVCVASSFPFSRTQAYIYMHRFGRRSGCRYGDDTAETTGSENFLTNTRCCVLPRGVWFASINV